MTVIPLLFQIIFNPYVSRTFSSLWTTSLLSRGFPGRIVCHLALAVPVL